MCGHCAEHKEENRIADNSSVSNPTVHTGSTEAYTPSKWKKFEKIVKVVDVGSEQLPDDFFFLKAGLDAAKNGTLKTPKT